MRVVSARVVCGGNINLIALLALKRHHTGGGDLGRGCAYLGGLRVNYARTTPAVPPGLTTLGLTRGG